jgi:NAD(P)-dependent dehydrogenase (short-subunit alcohol dehydrogenase family)
VSSENLYTLVTGASSGIGRAIAIELSKNRNLILHGRDLQRLKKTKELCAEGAHHIWEYDFEHVASLQLDFENFIQESQLRICSYVHSAGVDLPMAIRAVDLDAMRKVVDINASSAVLLTGSLLKRRIAGQTLTGIVFISSIAGSFGVSGKSLYGMSKGMLDAFVRAAAVELAPRVRINSICPAAVKTEMAQDVFNDPVTVDAMNRQHPLGTGKPDYIAGVVDFLLSEKAQWITGQQIFVDGGASVNMTFK